MFSTTNLIFFLFTQHCSVVKNPNKIQPATTKNQSNESRSDFVFHFFSFLSAVNSTFYAFGFFLFVFLFFIINKSCSINLSSFIV